MSIWDRFNSQLLDQIKSKYQGIFHDKFLLGLESFKTSQDLDSMVFAMFEVPEQAIQEPTPSQFDNFGKGNIGADTQVYMYLDQEIHKILGAFSDIKIPEAQNLIAHTLENFPRRSAAQAIMSRDTVPAIQQSDDRLKNYEKLLLIFQHILSRQEGPLYVSIESVEDLAFFGCLSLLDAFFTSKNGYYHETPFTATFWPQDQRSSDVAVISLDPATLKEIYQQGSETYSPQSIQVFESLNTSLKLKQPQVKLDQMLPGLLASSSFLWANSSVFKVNATEIAAMSENQRLLTLIKNKTALLEDSLTNLITSRNSPSVMQVANIDLRNAMVGIGKDIQTLMGEKRSLVKSLERATSQITSSKKAILSIAEEAGESALKATLNLLKIVDKTPDQPLPPIAKSPQDEIQLNLIQQYKKQLINKEKNLFQIQDKNKSLKVKRGELKRLFEGVINSAKNNWNSRLIDDQKLLQSYCAFSFFLLNEELFPQVSLKKEMQKKGAKKIAGFLKKAPYLKAFKQWKNPETIRTSGSAFTEILNNQAERIFKKYQSSPESYKYAELKNEDIERMIQVCQDVMQGDLKSLEKFYKLESVLEKFLVENAAFRKTLSESEKVNPKKTLALQAHMEAALVLSDEGFSQDQILSKPPESLFSRLLNSIVGSLNSDSIKQKIITENKSLLKELEEFSNKNLEAETVDRVISSALLKQGTSRSKDFKLAIRKTQNPLSQSRDVFGSIADYKKARDELKEYLNYQIFSDDYRWVQSIQDFKEIFSKGFDERLDYGLFGNFSQWRDKSERFSSEITNPKIRDYLRTYSFLISQEDLIENFRTYIQKNQKPLLGYENKQEAWVFADRHKVQDSRNLLLAASYLKLLEDKIRSLENSRLQYSVTNNPLSRENQIDLFSNNTLFKMFDTFAQHGMGNVHKSNEIYQDYLPIFLTSFVTTKQLLPSFAEEIRKSQRQFINHMPKAALINEQIEAYLRANSQGIRTLQEYIQGEVEKNRQLLENDPQEQATLMQQIALKAKQLLPFDINGLEQSIYRGMLSTLATSSFLYYAFGSLPLIGGMGFVSAVVLGSVLTFALYLSGYDPIDTIQSALNTGWEMINQLFASGSHSKTAPTDFLLDTFLKMFEGEIQLFEKFEDPKHQFAFMSYLQELFEVSKNIQSDIRFFGQRLSSLAPNATEQTNFSVMCLNMFYMLHRDIFRQTDDQLMQCSFHPHFPQAVESYLSQLKNSLSSIGSGFRGKKEVIDGQNTPYSRYIQQQIKSLPDKQLLLKFEGVDNPVCQVMGEESWTFAVTFERSFDFQNLDPSQSRYALEKLFETMAAVQGRQNKFLHDMRVILRRFETALVEPLGDIKKKQFAEVAVAAFEQIRLAFSMTSGWISSQESRENPYKPYFEATHERPSSFLSSSLFQSCLSTLTKTAQFADRLGLEYGRLLLENLREVRDYQEEFLKRGVFNKPPASLWESVKDNLFGIIEAGTSEVPLLTFPALLDLESSMDMAVCIAARNRFKNNLLEITDGVNELPFLNSSKILYITDTNLEVYFMNPQTRGYAFSPIMVQGMRRALKTLQDNELGLYLGVAQERNQELLNSLQPARYKLGFMRPQGRRAAQVGQSRVPSTQEVRDNLPREALQSDQSFLGGNVNTSSMNPEYGLPQKAYDPEGLGLSPEQAIQAYGNTIPQGVRNQIMEANQNIYQPVASQEAQTQNQRLSQQQPTQQSQMPQQSNQMPILPMMQYPIDEESQSIQQQVQEQPLANQEAPVQIGVNSQGGSFSMGAGSNAKGVPDDYFEFDQPSPALGQQRPDMQPRLPVGRPYQNPINQNYDPELPAEQGVNWGRVGAGAAIGGGAILGAALLGQMFGGKEEAKGRKRKR